jgi:hypothetical protein
MGKGQCYEVVTSVSLLTIRELMVKTAPIFLNKFTIIWHHAFAPCAQLFAFSPRVWVCSTLYALRPTFMKSTPGSVVLGFTSAQSILKKLPRFYFAQKNYY